MSDPRYWAWWQDKLAGVDVPASEGTPYAGFYRWIRNTGYGTKKYGIPVAYWPGNNGLLHCRVGFKDVSPQQGEELWVSVHNNPVPEDWYRDVTEKTPFPDEAWRDGLGTRPPRMGHNQPPEETDIEWLKETITEANTKAEVYLKGPPIADQLQADLVGNLADELEELWKKTETARKAERKPHDEALKEIQKKWAPIQLLAEVYKNLKFKLLTPWQLAQKQAFEEEAKAAVAAGETPPSEPRRPRAGTRGRAMSLRTFKSAEITDFEVCLNHFKNSPEIRDTVQDLANKAVRVGIEVPGAKLIEDQRTV